MRDRPTRPTRPTSSAPRARLSSALARLTTVLAVALTVACGGDSGTTPTPAVTVSVSPSSATVGAAETQTLTASVANASNSGVTWTATGGDLSGSGASVTWTAPLAGGSYTITATSTEDPSARASATITVTPVAVTVTAASSALLRGQPTTLTAAIGGTSASTEVTWAASCGTLTPDGATAAYQAPTEAGSCDVTATSVLDPTMSATVALAIRAASAVTADDDADDGACTWDHCSLREAITAANTVDGADTVYLSVAASAAAAAGAATGTTGPTAVVGAAPDGPAAVIQPSASLPTITSDLAIIGEGSQITEIDMRDLGRAFDISGAEGGASVTIRGLTVRNGRAPGGPAIYLRGGAVLMGMDLALIDNQAVGLEGGAMVIADDGTSAQLVDVVLDGNESDFPGGAIGVVAGGSLAMTGGAFRDNRSPNWGGAVRGIDFDLLHFDGTVFDRNLVVAPGFAGGAIFAENPGGGAGVVTLNNTSFTDNLGPGAATGGGGGGAVYLRNGIDATITGSTFTGNDAGPGGWGGALHLAAVDATISGSTITGNTGFIGGGIFINGADATIDDTMIDDNVGTERAGGIFVGITSTVDITGGSVSRNTAGDLGGAGIYAQQDPTISMDGTALIANEVVGNAAGGALAFFTNIQFQGTNLDVRDNIAPAAAGLYLFGEPGSSVQFTGSTFDNNQATGTGFAGGAILAVGEGSLSVGTSTISNNVADGRGGGIYASIGGGFTLSDSDVVGNRSNVHGGGLYLFLDALIERSHVQDNTATGVGGGLIGQSGTVIRGSTFTGNTAVAGGGVHFSHLTQGGTPRPRLENSTLSGNTAEDGGGISVVGTAEIVHVTIAGNTGTVRGGGAFVYSNGANVGDLEVTNSVFAQNQIGGGPSNCEIAAGSGATLTSGGGNVVDDASCSFALTSDQTAVDALLSSELGDNGGPTLTHALLAGSPAIDAGVDAGITTDQTGAARSDGAPDAGAVEHGG